MEKVVRFSGEFLVMRLLPEDAAKIPLWLYLSELDNNKLNPVFYYNFGLKLNGRVLPLDNGDVINARECFRLSASLDFDNTRTLLELAMLMQGQTHEDDAVLITQFDKPSAMYGRVGLLKRVFDLDPTCGRAWLELAKIKLGPMLSSSESYDETVMMVRKAFYYDESLTEAYLLLVRLAFLRGHTHVKFLVKPQKSIEEAAIDVISRDEKSAEAFYILGSLFTINQSVILKKHGALDRTRCFQMAAKLDSKYKHLCLL